MHVSVPSGNGRKFVISGLTLSVDAGEVVALVGESGSGKSMTALSLMRLLPHGAEINSGRISFAGRDILALSPSELDALRGADIGMLFSNRRPCSIRPAGSGRRSPSHCGSTAR